MAVPATTPPLLLTKRLNSFLHSHQSPQIPTLLLTTAHGKLLAHAGAQPVSVLRTHATVAASLLAIHTSSSESIPTSLPGAQTPDDAISASPASSERGSLGVEDDPHHEFEHGGDGRGRGGGSRPRAHRNLVKPIAITVQLSGGTVIIRRLKCGLLFVCVGPSASSNGHHHHGHDHGLHSSTHHLHHDEHNVGSPSEVESLISAGGQTTSSLESANAGPVVAMRRHVAELARWLDDKLGTLKVPEEGIGIEPN